MRQGTDVGRLVFLHGFTQTHRHWHRCAFSIARRLDHPDVVFVDLPGHGLSTDDARGIGEAAEAMTDLAGTGTYVGYSMGGRYALHAALTGDACVERLVLLGATPGIDADGERATRRTADEDRARRIGEIGVERFVDEWLAAPLFSTLPPERAGRRERLRNTAAGLAHSLRSAGTGVQASLWGRLGEVGIPALVLAGELDGKFTEIGTRMADALPNADFAVVAGAGHAAHAEQPDRTAAIVADWILHQAQDAAR